jgi:phosphoglucomutase
MEKMKEIMTGLRENPPAEIGGLKVKKISDYIKSVSVDTQTGEQTQITLPKSDVLVFELTGGASAIIRPSGTEPKIKVYYTTTGAEKASAQNLEKEISKDFQKILGF